MTTAFTVLSMMFIPTHNFVNMRCYYPITTKTII